MDANPKTSSVRSSRSSTGKTHGDLKEHIKTGEFREDLFYRISEVTINIPPLAERGGDAVLLAQAFLRRYAKPMGVEWEHPILDTVLLSAVVFGASETHTLDALSERLGVTIPPELRHTALGDAYATAEVLCKMLPMLEARGMHTFGDVITETRKHGRLLEDLN